MRSLNSLLRLTIVGLAIVLALGDQSCSPRKRNPHPEASSFQPKYSKSFDGQKLVFAVIGGRVGAFRWFHGPLMRSPLSADLTHRVPLQTGAGSAVKMLMTT